MADPSGERSIMGPGKDIKIVTPVKQAFASFSKLSYTYDANKKDFQEEMTRQRS